MDTQTYNQWYGRGYNDALWGTYYGHVPVAPDEQEAYNDGHRIGAAYRFLERQKG